MRHRRGSNVLMLMLQRGLRALYMFSICLAGGLAT